MTSSGLLTTMTVALGACFLRLSQTPPTMPALVLRRSSRLMPGLRAMPLVMTTRSLPATAAGSLEPVTLVSKPSSMADSIMSSALPWGMPSMMSIIVTSASSFSAIRWAVVEPTKPAPKTVTLRFMAMGDLRVEIGEVEHELARDGLLTVVDDYDIFLAKWYAL